MTRGDIWWADLGVPLGSEPGFRRPVLIVQDNAFNDSKINTIMVAALTTNLTLATAPGNIFLSKGESQLPRDSVINISQLAALDRTRFLKKAGRLSHALMDDVDGSLKLVLGLS
jgi:mRNA interferase MazF